MDDLSKTGRAWLAMSEAEEARRGRLWRIGRIARLLVPVVLITPLAFVGEIVPLLLGAVLVVLIVWRLRNGNAS